MKYFIDTETTGIEQDDEILSLAVIDENGQTILHEYFSPQYHVSWAVAQNINGISPEFVKYCPSFISSIDKICSSLKNVTELHGYNVNFDFNMMLRNGYRPSENLKLVDECAMCKTLFPALDHHRLSDMCRHFKISHLNQHNAEGDTLALYKLYLKLHDYLGQIKYEELEAKCSFFYKPATHFSGSQIIH